MVTSTPSTEEEVDPELIPSLPFLEKEEKDALSRVLIYFFILKFFCWEMRLMFYSIMNAGRKGVNGLGARGWGPARFGFALLRHFSVGAKDRPVGSSFPSSTSRRSFTGGLRLLAGDVSG
jgi:hypothetical protein